MSAEALLATLAMAPPVLVVCALIGATFASEDLTCVSAGVLVGTGGLDPWLALTGCAAGIVLGDFGVWALGRWGGPRFARAVPAARVAEAGAWVARNGALAAVLSRFFPGTRVPVYFAAGATRAPAARFLAWGALAALAWVPLLVLPVAHFGGALAGPLARALGTASWLVPCALAALVAVKLAPHVLARVRHHEFWPAWAFYLPLVPWYLLLSLRYRSFTVWTATNPGVENGGGVVGESKARALAQLDPRFAARTTLVLPGPLAERIALALEACDSFPVILKPDAGQRGAGVRKALDRADVEKYLAENPGAVLVQPFHAGPFEAGVFFYRLPGEARGRVFSITDKEFPDVTGDGRSTLAVLVRAHPRYRMQARVFLARHAAVANEVIPAGERFPLATAGNHCQGTLFRDGSHLLTPELESAINEALQPFAGFHFGRLDVRYLDPAEFRAGRGFVVIEVNGATSESTNLYEPSWSARRAYAVLFRQWALAFRIGAANRARGHRPLGALALLRLVRAYYRDRRVSALSD